MFKPKGRHVRQSQVEKFTRYSIRKVSFGAASVAVATGLFFLGGGSVQAAEQVTNSEPTEVQNPQNVNEKSSEPSREVTGQASATAKEPDGQNNTSVKESSPVNETSAVETPEVVAEKVAINTASLEDLVAKVEGRLSQLTEGKKTKSVIDDAKNLVNKAKELLNDDTKTQEKVNALAKQLSSSLFILNSIKSEATKVNKNQNPRNGQAIPSNGESGFRDTGTVADGTENPVVVNTNDITQKASELEAEIAKVESLISAENAKGEGQTDKELVGILTQVKESAQAVKNKGNNIPTTEKEKHALLQELKEKVDLLKLYQAKKLDWGAPANNHLANYGNNPSDAVISNLNDTFGTPDFSNATSHTKRVEDQASGIRGAINLGSATYHWKQKEITVDEAKAGALGGWKIVNKEGANTVNIVKPEAPTDIEYKEGQSATTYAPKPAKVYDNNGHVTATGGQGRPNAGGGVLNYMISTDRLGNGSIGKVNKDYYVELKKQGTTIYKDFDVNPNSHLYANLVFSSAYGKLGLSSTGEKIKMKIVDAYTGQPLSELTRKDGKASDTEFIGQPGSDSDGFAALWRVVKVPEGTTKVRVFVEAGDQPTTSDYLNGHKVEDGYIVAGLGLTPGPALTLTTTVVSGKDKEAYGYTEDSIYKNAQKGTFNVTLSNHGGVGVVYQTRYEVTLKVPKGVKLGTLQGTDLNEVNGKNLFAPSYTYDFKYNKDTRELTFKIDLSKRNINPTSGSSNTVSIPFEVTPDFVGEATFEVVGKNGFGGKDKLGNMILPFGISGADRYNIPVNVNANSLETSDNPDYKYNRSIYIDSMTGNSSITVPVGTTFEKAKEAATVSAEELLNSEAYREKLATLKATAALNLSETSSIAMVQGYSTAAVKENSGTLKVPVIHTIGSKNFNNQIDINVNVVASTKQQKVVFEGDTIQNDDIKGKITPATIPGYTATINNVQNMPTTTGKAGQIINVETTVSYTKGNVVLPETVTVPVLVLPKATGNVEVIKGSTVDKVKEVAKAKAEEVANSADFKAKLPEGSKDVEVGAITEEVLAAITTEAGTNKGTVKVPVTYTVDGVKYTKDAEITVNVIGSNADPVYVVEGDKPEVGKVKDAVKSGEGGTVQDPTEVDLPNTKDKVGATDVTVPTKVKYANGEETVKVPVTVLPKVTPEGVTVLKDSDKQELEKAIKEQAEKAANNVKGLPSGVTVRVTEVKTGTVPPTATVGVQNPATVVVEYVKDGKVVATKEVPVPVNVVEVVPVSIETPVTSTPLTPEDYTKGIKIPEGGKVTNVENIPDLTTPGKKEPVKVTVTLPNGKTITVEVPVNVTPVKEIETPVTKTPLTPEDYTKGIKIPEGGKVTNVENIPDLTTPGKKDPVRVTVELPNGKVVTVEVPVNVTPVKEIETPVTKTPLTPEDYAKGIKIPEGGKVTNVENIPDLTTPGKKDPVKVTVELPNGKVVTVEVPVNVTPVKEIETPVTKTPLTPEDYTKGIKIPEGGKVTNVENIPDLTTPGKKDPVKVTVELPNGKVITVEVPVNVTPVKPIETPVTSTPLTPEDYTKGIKIPEGGKVTNVENIPDLTIPGKKDPVKVTVELPNGKVITVEVPVTVTPINDIVKNVGDPITNEDVEKNVKIPEGGKIVSIGDKPGTDTPGVKPVVPVVIELPNGKQITVEVPVIVKPKVTPVVVPVGTPVTPEDVKKHIDLPEGWKITKVGEIPTTTTPGAKPSVTVEVELPDGRKITVEVPVIVTPKVSTIIVPQGTPITKDDVKNHIDLPKEPGWEIVEIGEIPSTIPAGVKPSVKVKVKLPNGKVIELEVPVISTPKVTPIEVEVGTPITKDDVKKHIELPKEPGWEIVEVGEIPTTETPGQKTAVKVKVKLPTGEIVELEVPVTVTPKATPAPRPTVKTTPIVVEVGTPITKEDVIKHVELPKGAEIVEVGEIPTTETAGQKASVKVKVKLPTGEIIEVEVPVTVTPKKETPALRPEKPSTPEVPATPEAPKAPVAKAGEKVLPNTGIADENSALAGLGLAILGLVGLRRRRKQK